MSKFKKTDVNYYFEGKKYLHDLGIFYLIFTFGDWSGDWDLIKRCANSSTPWYAFFLDWISTVLVK